MNPARDLRLTERRPRLCRLRPAEADFLRAHHPTTLALVPTATRHLYRVTPAGVAGVVVTPWRRVVISPKLPISNLLYLLAADAHITPDDHARPADGGAVLDLLAAMLADRLDDRLARGLHKGYRERDRHGPYLVGQLDVPATVRAGPGRLDQLHCRHDELTADLPCNQLPRAAAALLAGSPLVGAAARHRLAQALAGLGGISDVPLSQLLDHPAPPGYESLLALCRLLAHGQAPGERPGGAPCPAVLVSLERLFEQYVTGAVAAAFGEGEVAPQETTAVSQAPGQPGLSVRPDVTVRRGGEVIVVDAKWKRLPREALVTEDVYQALAYAALLGAGRAVLVYPGRRRAMGYAFARTPLRLEVRGLDVAGPLARCARARRRLGRDLRRALG